MFTAGGEGIRYQAIQLFTKPNYAVKEGRRDVIDHLSV